jgi:hypothetical protein
MADLSFQIGQLKTISASAQALADFSEAISKNSHFQSEGNRFVLRPANFVTFTVHYKRGNHITVSVRGAVSEFEGRKELAIKKDQNGYSAFKFESADQLEAATYYVKRAAELYERGRTRSKKTPKTVEV